MGEYDIVKSSVLFSWLNFSYKKCHTACSATWGQRFFEYSIDGMHAVCDYGVQSISPRFTSSVPEASTDHFLI